MFQMLTHSEIKKWLKSLIKTGAKKGSRHGVSLPAVSLYLNIPMNSLEWLARKDTARIGIERQRDFSKLISLLENGMLETMRGGYKNKQNLIVPREIPKIMLKYQVHFGPRGVGISAAPKPKIPTSLPTMKELLARN